MNDYNERPTRDETAMETAKVFAKRSTCSRASVGAVITVANRVVATGYNGAPAGMPHCDHTIESEPCRNAVHAEANAVAFAARHGAKLEGGTLYTTMVPCLACAQLLINAGIQRVVAAQPYRDRAGLELLSLAGLQVEVLPRFDADTSS